MEQLVGNDPQTVDPVVKARSSQPAVTNSSSQMRQVSESTVGAESAFTTIVSMSRSTEAALPDAVVEGSLAIRRITLPQIDAPSPHTRCIFWNRDVPTHSHRLWLVSII